MVAHSGTHHRLSRVTTGIPKAKKKTWFQQITVTDIEDGSEAHPNQGDKQRGTADLTTPRTKGPSLLPQPAWRNSLQVLVLSLSGGSTVTVVGVVTVVALKEWIPNQTAVPGLFTERRGEERARIPPKQSVPFPFPPFPRIPPGPRENRTRTRRRSSGSRSSGVACELPWPRPRRAVVPMVLSVVALPVVVLARVRVLVLVVVPVSSGQ